MGLLVILKKDYVYGRIEQRSKYINFVGIQASQSERSYKYKIVKGKNGMKWIFPPVCPLKGHEYDTSMTINTLSFQILGSNITAPKKEPGVLRKNGCKVSVDYLVHKLNDSTVASLNRLQLTKSGTI